MAKQPINSGRHTNLGGFLSKIIRYIKDPVFRFTVNHYRGLTAGMPDEKFVKLQYQAAAGLKLNLDDPKGFNEKLQWLKLHDRRPVYTTMADKIDAKKFAGDIIGSDYIVPLLGVWDDPADIDFDALPDQFVLKCNHNSGLGMYICSDKSTLNRDEVIKNLRLGLKQDYYLACREWPYKSIKRRVFAEAYLNDGEHSNGLIDYKFYCFNGEPKFFYLGYANFTDGEKADLVSFFEMDFTQPPFYRTDHEPYPFKAEKPACFDEMVEAARKLSSGIPFVRVDMFLVGEKAYFAECTFFPGGGYGIFQPPEWERRLGDLINLPR